MRRVVIAAVVCLLLVPAVAGQAAPPAATGHTGHALATGPAAPVVAASEGEVAPINLVIAVDESGSLSEDDAAQERTAAAFTSVGELSRESVVTVFGFGGGPGTVPAVNTAGQCQLRPPAAAPTREAMSRCVEQNIKRRAKGQGDSTDFVQALRQGIDTLSRGPADQPRLLFLLTDGKLDVEGDTRYGSTVPAQMAEANRQLDDDVLPKARAAGVQIWPLGFGAQIDSPRLAAFAAGGAKGRCGGEELAAKAEVVRDAITAAIAMQKAFALARCIGADVPAAASLPGGATVNLTITVPAVATDGSIQVAKRDPNVQVRYFDPDGVAAPPSGTNEDGSTFERSGESGVVESMHISNPQPGQWRIQLTAPAGLATQLVLVSALWQGVLKAVFIMDPPSPTPGNRFSVTMRPQTRFKVLDPEALAGLSFSAQLSGKGVNDEVVGLADDGQGADPRAGDGYFSAYLTLPGGASGRYVVTGIAKGPGVESDRHQSTFDVAQGQAPVQAKIRMGFVEARAADTVTGTVEVTNSSGAARAVRLELADLRSGVRATVAPVTFEAGPGNSTTDFRVAFAKDTALGPSGGVVRLVDAGSGATLANVPLGVEILPEPTLWDRWWWALLLLGALLLVIVVVVVLGLVKRMQERDVRGLAFTLYHRGRELSPTLGPDSDERADEFEFDIRVAADGTPATLMRVDPGTNRYVARRGRGGMVVVRVPVGGALRLEPSRPAEVPHLSEYSIRVTDAGPPQAQPDYVPTARTDPDSRYL